MDPAFLIGIILVIFSIILHEVAHGYVANWLGDPTARLSGRLTLNPIPHIDPIGSVLLPGILAFSGSPFLMGWAKPVPFNPYNLRHGKWGEALVALGGPATNVIIAVIFGLVLRFFGGSLSPLMIQVFVIVSVANLSLAILNLIPIPPLDGSKILKAILPYPLSQSYAGLERTTYMLGPAGLFIVLLIFVNLLSAPVSAFVYWLFSLIVGAS
jgi:Zn-dependent protease